MSLDKVKQSAIYILGVYLALMLAFNKPFSYLHVWIGKVPLFVTEAVLGALLLLSIVKLFFKKKFGKNPGRILVVFFGLYMLVGLIGFADIFSNPSSEWLHGFKDSALFYYASFLFLIYYLIDSESELFTVFCFAYAGFLFGLLYFYLNMMIVFPSWFPRRVPSAAVNARAFGFLFSLYLIFKSNWPKTFGWVAALAYVSLLFDGVRSAFVGVVLITFILGISFFLGKFRSYFIEIKKYFFPQLALVAAVVFLTQGMPPAIGEFNFIRGVKGFVHDAISKNKSSLAKATYQSKPVLPEVKIDTKKNIPKPVLIAKSPAPFKIENKEVDFIKEPVAVVNEKHPVQLVSAIPAKIVESSHSLVLENINHNPIKTISEATKKPESSVQLDSQIPDIKAVASQENEKKSFLGGEENLISNENLNRPGKESINDEAGSNMKLVQKTSDPLGEIAVQSQIVNGEIKSAVISKGITPKSKEVVKRTVNSPLKVKVIDTNKEESKEIQISQLPANKVDLKPLVELDNRYIRRFQPGPFYRLLEKNILSKNGNVQWRVRVWTEVVGRVVQENILFGFGFGVPLVVSSVSPYLDDARFILAQKAMKDKVDFGARMSDPDVDPQKDILYRYPLKLNEEESHVDYASEYWYDIDPHNSLVAIFFRMGLLGLISFLGIFFCILKSLIFNESQRPLGPFLMGLFMLWYLVSINFNVVLEGPFMGAVYWVFIGLFLVWIDLIKKGKEV